MRSQRSFYILAGVTIAMVVAAAMSQWSSRESASDLGPHLPGFESGIDQVNTVLIRTAEQSLRLERTGDGWVARDKNDYPADGERIRQLVLTVSGLQRLEKKTSNPGRFAQIGLTDVDEQDSEAVEVTFQGEDDARLASLLVGKTHEFVQSGRSRYFVRNADETQSWLVEGALPLVLDDISEWLHKELLAPIEQSDIGTVKVTHADGEQVSIHRDSGDEETDFQLDGLSEGEVIDNQYSVNAIANTLQRLALKGLHDPGSTETGEEVATVEARTFNGVRVAVDFNKLEKDYVVELSAAYEPEQEQEVDEEGTNGEQLAAELDKRWQDRKFVVSQYTVDAIIPRRSDLVKQADQTASQ